jgi:2'-5' RNA ligase
MSLHRMQQQVPRGRRVFFAIPPQDSCRAALVHAVRKAVRASGGRPVPPPDLHITLAFIGHAAPEQLTLLKSAAASVPVAPFEFQFDHLEHWVRSQVLCVSGSRPPRAGEALVHALRSAIMRHDIRLDPHPWKPHVTVARNVLNPHLLGPIAPLRWPAAEFGLFESLDPPQAPRYRALALWPLAAAGTPMLAR